MVTKPKPTTPRHVAVSKGIKVLTEYSLPLLFGVLLGLTWANLAPGSYDSLLEYSFVGHDAHFDTRFLVNEIFMALFFGLATKEVVESMLPGGDLSPIKRAINPLFATFGGIVGPALIYIIIVYGFGSSELLAGWAIPTATDIAMAWLVARFLLGASHPAVSYLLLLAIVDDGVGLAIICFFYPTPNATPNPVILILVIIAMAWAFFLRKNRTFNHWAYVCGPGLLSWVGLYKAHLHPALALVPIIPFFPSADKDLGLFVEETPELTDTLGHFDKDIRRVVEFGLFGFGIVNAGVPLSAIGLPTVAVSVGLLFGKPAGIFVFGSFAKWLGFDLPVGMGYRELFFVGIVAGLGLTVSLFISAAAFSDVELQAQAKMGALCSVFSVFIAYTFIRIFRIPVRT